TLISRLSSGLPGMTAGPDLPPSSSACLESRRKPPSLVWVWQEKQLSARIGRISVSKKSAPATGSGAAIKAGAVSRVKTRKCFNIRNSPLRFAHQKPADIPYGYPQQQRRHSGS